MFPLDIAFVLTGGRQMILQSPNKIEKLKITSRSFRV